MSLFHEATHAPRDKLSFHGVLRVEDQTFWTGISVLRPEMIQAIRFNLTRSLSKALPLLQQELQFSFNKELGNPNEDWKAIPLLPSLRRVVALLAGRLLLGLPLSRDERWLDLSVNSSQNLATVRTAVLKWSKALQPLAVPFLPQVRAARRTRKQAIQFMEPYIKDFLDTYKRDKPTVEIGSPGTAFSWMMQHADECNKSVAVMADNYLEMMAVSVNGTAKACYQTVFDILSEQKYIPALRDELEKAIAADGMQQDGNGKPYIRKETYARLRLLDSCIKETLRHNPSQLISINRHLETDYTFSNGLKLTKGTLTSFNMWGVTHSTETTTYSPGFNAGVGNPGPQVYDGFRFARLRTVPGQKNRHLAVTTGPESFNFGHGPFACPGRFFGVDVIKTIIIDILLHFDIRLPPKAKGKRPANIVVDQYVVPDGTALVEIRTRSS
jgi:cytochrome P450 monooxygenase-3